MRKGVKDDLKKKIIELDFSESNFYVRLALL